VIDAMLPDGGERNSRKPLRHSLRSEPELWRVAFGASPRRQNRRRWAAGVTWVIGLGATREASARWTNAAEPVKVYFFGVRVPSSPVVGFVFPLVDQLSVSVLLALVRVCGSVTVPVFLLTLALTWTDPDFAGERPLPKPVIASRPTG